MMAAAQPDTVRVSLVTFMPGSEIFELYGHAELRVTRGSDFDYYFNYGVFDFEAPNFTARFVAGQTDYLCMAVPARYATVGMEGRKMVEQDLNLTQEQATELATALIVNSAPENRTYRYRYFGDNCSTRPRDMVESAVGDIRYSPLEADTAIVTLRDIIHRYCRNYPWERLGIDLALGSEIDKPITGREAMFVPMQLMHAIDGATIERDGQRVPLVARTRVMVDGNDDGTVLPPTPWFLHPVTVLCFLLLAVICISFFALRRTTNNEQRTTRNLLHVLDTVILIALGLLGCLLCYLVFVSTHEATSPNWNLLWLNPIYLLAAIATLQTGHSAFRRSRWKTVVLAIAAAMPLVALVAWPFVPQVGNVAFLPIGALATISCLNHLISR